MMIMMMTMMMIMMMMMDEEREQLDDEAKYLWEGALFTLRAAVKLSSNIRGNIYMWEQTERNTVELILTLIQISVGTHRGNTVKFILISSFHDDAALWC